MSFRNKMHFHDSPERLDACSIILVRKSQEVHSKKNIQDEQNQLFGILLNISETVKPNKMPKRFRSINEPSKYIQIFKKL